MKTLFVLRHAAAADPASAPSDFERPLKPRGRQQALDLGAMMSAKQVAFDVIVASPAARVVETISGIGQGAGRVMESAFDRRIYNASMEALVEVIRGTDDRFERIMLVGHNPGLQELLLRFAERDPDGYYDEIASSFSTATLAELDLAVEHWREAGVGRGRIVSLYRPDVV